jgi:hypothetical protein
MGITVTTTWGCCCRGERVCAYHATIRRIEESGTGLYQRLAVVEYSSIPEMRREGAIIRAELAARRLAFLKADGAA